jgi:hypothetical protein
LIVVPEIPQKQGPRLESIQQSKDFLEVVRWKAERYDVSVELHEVRTGNVHEHIKRLVRDLHCHSIVVVTDGKEGILFDTQEIANLLVGTIPASLVLMRLPAPGQSASRSAVEWLHSCPFDLVLLDIHLLDRTR